MKASVFAGVSVDGFIARTNDDLDWLPDDPGEGHGYEEFIATVDAIVTGRRTYEKVLTFGTWPYTKPVFVLTTSAVAAPPEGAVVEFLSASPAEVLAQLAVRGFEHIYVDGGITVQRFLNAGLIDRLIVTRVPVLIGSGIPLFGPIDRDVKLRHVATRALATGLVQTEYAIDRP
jgi:dihydrofolate reductase